MNAFPVLAVKFQSMYRISSCKEYSRHESNSMPCPTKSELNIPYRKLFEIATNESWSRFACSLSLFICIKHFKKSKQKNQVDTSRHFNDIVFYQKLFELTSQNTKCTNTKSMHLAKMFFRRLTVWQKL